MLNLTWKHPLLRRNSCSQQRAKNHKVRYATQLTFILQICSALKNSTYKLGKTRKGESLLLPLLRLRLPMPLKLWRALINKVAGLQHPHEMVSLS